MFSKTLFFNHFGIIILINVWANIRVFGALNEHNDRKKSAKSCKKQVFHYYGVHFLCLCESSVEVDKQLFLVPCLALYGPVARTFIGLLGLVILYKAKLRCMGPRG